MTNIMIIIDGMTDRPCARLDGLTPFEYANCTHMNYMRANGAYGNLNICPKNFAAESLACILTLLGVPPEKIPAGRAYLEALAEGLAVGADDLALRCNLVRIENGRLASCCCENLNEKDFAKTAQRALKITDDQMEFRHMRSYKNLLVIKNAKDQLENLHAFAPHEHIGAEFKNLYPVGSELAGELRHFIDKSMRIFNQKSDNDIKYAYLPWGQACRQDIPSFYELHKMSSVTVCATEIVRGLSSAMDMQLGRLQGATADTNTSLFNKCSAVLQYIHKKDFILLHINGADEAAHRKNPKEKAEFIRKIDYEIVAPLLYYSSDDTGIMICSDHSTLSETGAHAADAQPFILYRKNRKSKGDLGLLQGIEAVRILNTY